MASVANIASRFSLRPVLALMAIVALTASMALALGERLMADEPAAGAAAKSAPPEYFPAPSSIEQRILAALGEPTEMDMTQMPLQDAVDYLQDLHHIQIQLDGKSLQEAGIGSDTPVTRRIKGIPLRSALRLMLEPMDLAFVVRDDVLLIMTKEKADVTMFTRIYPIGDLVEPGQEGSLVAAMTTTIMPSSWDKVGGPGQVAVVQSARSLAIAQTQAVHEEILELLRALRAARKLVPLKPAAN